jgi:hypothetical protein
MPQSVEMVLQVGGGAPDAPKGFPDTTTGVTGNVYQIQWPATATKTEGGWLWIVDDGGCSVPPAHGWVRKDVMLKLTDKDGVVDAYAFYMTELGRYPDPKLAPFWLHWLLGITLESRNDTKDTNIAIKEYWRAIGQSEGPEKIDVAQDSLKKAYQVLYDLRKSLEGEASESTVRDALPLLQAARTEIERADRLIGEVEGLGNASRAPAWALITLRRRYPQQLPTESDIDLIYDRRTRTADIERAKENWNNLAQVWDWASDELQQERIIVDADVANAVAWNRNLLDAAVRLEKLRAADRENTTVSIALEAAEQLDRMRTGITNSTCTIWVPGGYLRPQVSYEEGQALKNVLEKASDPMQNRQNVAAQVQDLKNRRLTLRMERPVDLVVKMVAQTKNGPISTVGYEHAITDWRSDETVWKEHEDQWADDEDKWSNALDNWAQDRTRWKRWDTRRDNRDPMQNVYVPVPSDFVRTEDDACNFGSEKRSRIDCIAPGVITPPYQAVLRDLSPNLRELSSNPVWDLIVDAVFPSSPRYRTDSQKWRYDKWIWAPFAADDSEEEDRMRLFEYAEKCYQDAQRLNRNWWLAQCGNGELYLGMATRYKKEAERYAKKRNSTPVYSRLYDARTGQPEVIPRPPREDLTRISKELSDALKTDPKCKNLFDRVATYAQAAVTYFDESVRLKADQVDAYRDRAQAYEIASLQETPAYADSYAHIIEKLNNSKRITSQVRQDAALIGIAADRAANDIIIAALKDIPPPNGPQSQEDVNDYAKRLFAVRESANSIVSAESKVFAGNYPDAQDDLNTLLSTIRGHVNLKKAQASANTACEKGNFSKPESLVILAEISAAMCDYERAVHYQRLAVIYAQDTDRPEDVTTLQRYKSNLIPQDASTFGHAARRIEVDPRDVEP